jgi:hypothetical protein
MTRYFFHLAGQLPAHDLVGHECNNDDEARKHGSLLARGVENEYPEGGLGRFISVTNETGDELFKIPIGTGHSQDQGIIRAGRGEEQPTDKERAQTVHKTESELH